jgi:Uma2 family endonuclease
MATAIARPSPTHSAERAETLADLLRRLGNVPARRVRLYPAPGTATEKDLIRNNESKLKTAICELVDGTLVEKAMGWVESQIAAKIIHYLVEFVEPRRLGVVLGADGMIRLVPGLIRVPDVSFLARGKLSRSRQGQQPVPSVAPDLAVEVVSKSNTKAEIDRKLSEYFAAGARLAWVVDPKTEAVRVHTSPRERVVLGLDDFLDGSDVLPGLRISVRNLFEEES